VSRNVHEARLIERREIAQAIDELVFEVEGEPLHFRAGQFISLRVGEEAEGAAILRSYSLASLPGSPRFSLIVKRIPGGLATRYLEALPPGTLMRFTGPMGFFVLELAHPGDVVFGVTGVGIAPVLPMLHELLARTTEHGRVHLLWGSRHRSELFWQAELAALRAAHPRFSVRTFLSAPGEATEGLEAGRISTPILTLASALDRPTFYLVGLGAMIREVKAGLVAAGFDRKRQIRNEAFFN